MNWIDRRPLTLYIEDLGEATTKKEIQEEVLVPAMGFITLVAGW